MSMIGKRLFLVLAAGALLLLQFADCMSAMTPDQESMHCCGSMPCTPAQQKHDCCISRTGSRCFVAPAIRRVHVCHDARPREYALLRLDAMHASEPKPRLL